MFRMLFAAALALSLPAAALAQQAEQQQQQGQQAQQKPQMNLTADADSIMGKTAMTQQGEEIGQIEDVLVAQDGRVQAVIIEHDGAKRPVPWDQLAMQGDQVTVKLNPEQMSQLPAYNAEKQ